MPSAPAGAEGICLVSSTARGATTSFICRGPRVSGQGRGPRQLELGAVGAAGAMLTAGEEAGAVRRGRGGLAVRVVGLHGVVREGAPRRQHEPDGERDDVLRALRGGVRARAEQQQCAPHQLPVPTQLSRRSTAAHSQHGLERSSAPHRSPAAPSRRGLPSTVNPMPLATGNARVQRPKKSHNFSQLSACGVLSAIHFGLQKTHKRPN